MPSELPTALVGLANDFIYALKQFGMMILGAMIVVIILELRLIASRPGRRAAAATPCDGE